MAKYKITGVPSQTVPDVTLNHSLGPVDRDIANVEAERGETVVTNMSRGLDNIFEMYSIGGKKHTEGGTPLALPTDGDKETDGTSFIFSDNKKMVVKDPAILEYFGVDPKKPKTYADISKTWLDAVNKSKQIIKDDVSDKISKKSAEMSMDNAAFKIAALKLKQEAHKGMRDGVPNGMSPFFDKLQLDPSEMFAMNQDDADKTEQAVTSAFGGTVKKADGGPLVNPFLYTNNQGQDAQIIGGGFDFEHKSGLRGGANLELPFNNRNAQSSSSQNIGFGKTFENKNGATFRGDATLNNNSNAEQGMFNPSANLSFNYDQPVGKNTSFHLGLDNDMTPGSLFNPNVSASLKYKFDDGGDLQKFVDKGEVSKASTEPKDELSWGSIAPKAKKQYDYITNILAKDEDFKDALFVEYNKAAAEEGNFGVGYNDQFKKVPTSKGSVVRKDKEQVFQDYLDFQKRNLMLNSHGKKVAETDQDPTTRQSVSNKDVTEWSIAYGVPLPSRMDDAAAQQLSFIAFENLSKNRDVYGEKLKKVLKPFGTNPVGKGDEKIAGSKAKGNISPADGAYTNTTAGEISYFTPPTEEEKKDIKTVVENTPYVPKAPNYSRLNPITPLNNPYGFRREDINSLRRAVQARFEIPQLHPYAKSAAVVMPDRAYYSPERDIAAKNEQLNIMMQNQNAFGNAQSAGANAMALSGQAYGDVANAISNYADKNVGIFNAGEQYNAQLATQRNQLDSQMAMNTWDKENTLKQNLANSISAAKDKITQLSNQAYTNASNMYNLNSMTENFKKDPYTGLITKFNDKALTLTKDNAQSFGQEFNDFAKSMPTVTGDLQMKAFLAMKSGKYVIEKDDEVTKPNELTNQYYPR
jgi:hypothetical protein